jgi:Uma2 family endonuclease
MNIPLASFVPPKTIFYPESDGLPLADNSLQLRWITVIYGNLAALFADRADVWVCGNQYWYPVKGQPELRYAPDVYVVFGRPKHERGSYQQWEEDDVPMTVVFEILSPGNKPMEMVEKLAFYDEYGAEEYYIYDPDEVKLAAFHRQGEVFRRIRPVSGLVSPRLGIRFDLSGKEMVVFHPDGEPFRTFEELMQLRREAELRANSAETRASAAETRVATARMQLARLAELSRKARHGQTSVEELAELERLEQATEPPAE